VRSLLLLLGNNPQRQTFKIPKSIYGHHLNL
jgi:hypothetical protein